MVKERQTESRHIGIFAVIATAAFVLTVLFYKIDLFPFEPIHSDGNGYYMYLPAVFVYHDPGMHFVEGLAEDISGFSGTFFPMDTGQVVDKYTMGVAVLQLPFFLIADLLTKLFLPGQADGFSLFYQLGNIAGGCFYYFLGAACMYRTAKKHTDAASAFGAVLLITFGTGLFHYITMDGSYSHVYSFAMIALFILLVEKHEKSQTVGMKFLGGLCFGMLTLVRVTNAVIVLIYICYRAAAFRELRERICKIVRPGRILPILAGIFPVWIPQLLYWKWAAGSFLVNSYDLPGNVWQEHFNWLEPKLLEVLFLPNRGLFFWCPIVVLCVIAALFLRREDLSFRWGMIAAFAAFTYITASWWAYDGFCGFTNRFFVDLSAVFIFQLAVFLHWAKQHCQWKWPVRIYAVLALLWTNLFMMEYWCNRTTMFQVTMEDIRQVFLWYLDFVR